MAIAQGFQEHWPEGAIAIDNKGVMKYIKGKMHSNYKNAVLYAEMLKSIDLDLMKDASLWPGYLDQLRQIERSDPALSDQFKKLEGRTRGAIAVMNNGSNPSIPLAQTAYSRPVFSGASATLNF